MAWLQPWRPDVERADPARMAYALPDKPSLAVLPFDNLSDDKSLQYFSDGVTEDIITDLSKITGLFVVARNSTFTYKGSPVEVRQVAEDMGVRYVLEGSVRRARNPIGHPVATLVEDDQAGERAECTQPSHVVRVGEPSFERRNYSRRHHDVRRAVAPYLVGDVKVSAFGVLRGRKV